MDVGVAIGVVAGVSVLYIWVFDVTVYDIRITSSNFLVANVTGGELRAKGFRQQ